MKNKHLIFGISGVVWLLFAVVILFAGGEDVPFWGCLIIANIWFSKLYDKRDN